MTSLSQRLDEVFNHIQQKLDANKEVVILDGVNLFSMMDLKTIRSYKKDNSFEDYPDTPRNHLNSLRGQKQMILVLSNNLSVAASSFQIFAQSFKSDLIDQGTKAFALALSMGALQSLLNLDLRENNIADEGIKAFCKTLSMGALHHLQHLYLADNTISDEGMKAPADAISEGGLIKVKHLYLHGNNIGDEGIEVFSKSMGALNNLEPNWAFALALSMGALHSLTSLDLDHNQIGDEGMKAFVLALSRGALRTLTSLDLAQNQIGDEGMEAFVLVLSMGALNNLTSLDLSQNRIGDEGMKAFTQSMGALSHLKIVNGEAVNISV